VRSDARTTLDVLVRVVPAAREIQRGRQAVNLGLVLDRSGSMAAENKIGFAREAAIYAVQQLLATERVSVVVFDDKVEIIVPNTWAAQKTPIVQLLQRVQPGGSTALHAAWVEGCKQVSRFLLEGGLNRVLLLSDGIANVGQINPDTIAYEVKAWSHQGVSSTVLGVVHDYNEDMLEAIARSGDGNYYYIQSPAQLSAIFQTELRGLLLTAGTKVSLGIEPLQGVTVLDVLNDLEKTEHGRLKLSNLIGGMPIEVVVRLSVPPLSQAGALCRFRLAWDVPGQRQRQVVWATLALPVHAWTDWERISANADVEERAVLLLVARLKKQATEEVEKGAQAAAERCINAAKELLGTVPISQQLQEEMLGLAALEANLMGGELNLFTKAAKYEHYWRTHTRPRT
jgi:Ca-activated chloride channel family protein